MELGNKCRQFGAVENQNAFQTVPSFDTDVYTRQTKEENEQISLLQRFRENNWGKKEHGFDSGDHR